jgi:hypothetical protein
VQLTGFAAHDPQGVGYSDVLGILRGAILGRFNPVGFSWREKEIALNAVLFGVKLVIPSLGGVQLFVISTFDYLTLFDDKNLIGAANRREPVSDDKGGSAAH